MKLDLQKLKRISKRTSLLAAVSFYGLGMLALTGAALASKDMPSAETLWAPNRPVSVQIVDRYGRDVLVRGASYAPKVKLKDLPAHVPCLLYTSPSPRDRG